MNASDFDSEDFEGPELGEFVAVVPVLAVAENDVFTEYGPGLLTGGLYSNTQVNAHYVVPSPTKSWTILLDAKARLQATGQFDEVLIGDPSEQLASANATALAILQLREEDEGGYEDTVLEKVTKWELTVAARQRDPEVRDMEASRLVEVARNALDHKSLASITYPDWTILRRSRFEKPKDSERRVTIAGEWGYHLDDAEEQ
jgi:hypothetical protein